MHSHDSLLKSKTHPSTAVSETYLSLLATGAAAAGGTAPVAAASASTAVTAVVATSTASAAEVVAAVVTSTAAGNGLEAVIGVGGSGCLSFC